MNSTMRASNLYSTLQNVTEENEKDTNKWQDVPLVSMFMDWKTIFLRYQYYPMLSKLINTIL